MNKKVPMYVAVITGVAGFLFGMLIGDVNAKSCSCDTIHTDPDDFEDSDFEDTDDLDADDSTGAAE